MPAWPQCEPSSPGELSVATGLEPIIASARRLPTEPSCPSSANAEPFLGPFLVPDRESTESVLLHHGVTEVDLGRRRVDSQEEQPAGSQRRRRLGEVRGRVGHSAVLKDLNGDEVVEHRVDLEIEKVPAREAGPQLGSASGELVDRFPGDVEPLEVQPGVDEGQIVAAVAAADLEAGAAERARVCPQRGDDLASKRQGRLGSVPPVAILGVPACRDKRGAQTSPFSRIVFSSHNQM